MLSQPLKLSGAEKQKLYRARRNADPEKREKYLLKEKERWRRDIQTGRKKLIGQKSKTEQHMQRMKWKQAYRRRRSKREAVGQRDPKEEEEEALRQASAPFELDPALGEGLSVVSLCKLVRWAHSHGTICSLIPDLQQLTPAHGADVPVTMWGCSAGHAYYWTPSDHGNICGGLANSQQGQVSGTGAYNFPGVDPTSELVEFKCPHPLDASGDFSATDDSEDYETPRVGGKEIKEESLDNDSYLNINRALSEAHAVKTLSACTRLSNCP